MTYAAAGPALYFFVITIVFGMNRVGVAQGTTVITGIVLAVIAAGILFWIRSRTS